MFGEYSNIQLGGDLLKTNDPKFNLMHGFEQNVSLFFNDVSKNTNMKTK